MFAESYSALLAKMKLYHYNDIFLKIYMFIVK